MEPKQDAPDSSAPPKGGKDEVALELMKFITLQTGYGRAAQASAGFSGKPGTHSPEEHAEGLLELFRRCRKVVGEEK
ncbi:MAG: hypothetical protein ABSH56_36850 [Bryobacteraceae bacterium]